MKWCKIRKLSLFQKLSEFVKHVQFRRVGFQNDEFIHVRTCYLFRNYENRKQQLNWELSTKLDEKSMDRFFNAYVCVYPCLGLACTECTTLKAFDRPCIWIFTFIVSSKNDKIYHSERAQLSHKESTILISWTFSTKFRKKSCSISLSNSAIPFISAIFSLFIVRGSLPLFTSLFL